MKIKQQLSITTLIMAGVFATGCSQQQVEGGSQVAGASQQQVEEPVVMAAKPAPTPAPQEAQAPAPVVVPVNRWGHTHPAIPRCTDSIRHTHKYNNARHSHTYSCRGAVAPQPPKVDVYALQRKLKAKGYYKGPIDGVVGPSTRSALKGFMNR